MTGAACGHPTNYRLGLRGYRIDRSSLPGRPDLAWGPAKVAVFVDGAFWHGHPSAYTPGKSGLYWDEKITRNCRRDREADARLVDLGWTVIRLCHFEVRRDLNTCVQRIHVALNPSTERDATPAVPHQ